MKTPERRNNVRASARAARLEAARVLDEEKAAAVIEAQEPEPEAVLPVVVTEPTPDPGPLPVEEGELAQLAHEINTRFTKAEYHQRLADDQRLANALQLARARALCVARKIQFKTWVAGHLTLKLSYTSALKLAVIGASDNPEAALHANRSRNAEANREHRKQKALAAPVIALPEAPPVSRDPLEAVAHGTVDLETHDVASEEVPVLLESDRLGNVLAGLRRLLVPDQVKALKVLAKDIPRESVIDALRTVGFVIVGFNLETAAE